MKLFADFNPCRPRRRRFLRFEELERKVLLAVTAGEEVFLSSGGSGTLAAEADPTEKIAVSVVIADTLPAEPTAEELPVSLDSTRTGDTLYAQIWVKNIDGSTQACVGGYVDLTYTESLFRADSFSVSSLYPNLATYVSTETSGRVTLIGGMASPGETSQGTESWALLGSVSFTVVGTGEGAFQTVSPSRLGAETEVFNLARSGVGTIPSAEIQFGGATVNISDSQITPPSITTGDKGVYVSYGLNRHQISWTVVEGSSSYELAWSVAGGSFNSLKTDGLSAVVTGLPYGADVTYKVCALVGGGIVSSWSSEKSFYVCPVDIDGDGDVSSADRALLTSCWLSEEGDDEFIAACDINGDGAIAAADRLFLAANWLFNLEDDLDDFVYPPTSTPFFDGNTFESLSDSEIEFFS